jgi:hypothetical protein
LPSQVPSSPQVETSVFGQTDAERGGAPAGTKVQVPGAEVVLHDLHVSVQALLQQTPSTQKPLAQSALQAQVVPLVLAAPASPAQTAGIPPSGGLFAGLLEWQATTPSINRSNAVNAARRPPVPFSPVLRCAPQAGRYPVPMSCKWKSSNAQCDKHQG